MKTELKIKKILLELVDTLERLSKEQDNIVRNIFEKTKKDNLDRNKKFDDEEDKDFYYSIVDILKEDSDIEELFDGNETALLFYTQNLETYDSLLNYAIEIYELYDNLNIEYFDKIKEKKLLEIQTAKEKDIINVKEFELLYGYGKESQKGYRSRLHNQLPYIQKTHGSMILYSKVDIENWLKNIK